MVTYSSNGTADGRTRTGTGLYSPTDFKSVASTIPPHRRSGVHSKLLLILVEMDFALGKIGAVIKKCDPRESYSVVPITAWEVWGVSSNLLESLEENGLK